jgi:hypothetical protein
MPHEHFDKCNSALPLQKYGAMEINCERNFLWDLWNTKFG